MVHGACFCMPQAHCKLCSRLLEQQGNRVLNTLMALRLAQGWTDPVKASHIHDLPAGPCLLTGRRLQADGVCLPAAGLSEPGMQPE